MINTIKAVHLSTVADRAVFQGRKMKRFPAEAVMKCSDRTTSCEHTEMSFLFSSFLPFLT